MLDYRSVIYTQDPQRIIQADLPPVVWPAGLPPALVISLPPEAGRRRIDERKARIR